MEHHRLPRYIREVVWDYLRDRSVVFKDAAEAVRGWAMYCGVPQRSIFGPFLWNLAYDRVLWTPLPVGCHVICYADDTLVVAVGED